MGGASPQGLRGLTSLIDRALLTSAQQKLSSRGSHINQGAPHVGPTKASIQTRPADPKEKRPRGAHVAHLGAVFPLADQTFMVRSRYVQRGSPNPFPPHAVHGSGVPQLTELQLWPATSTTDSTGPNYPASGHALSCTAERPSSDRHLNARLQGNPICQGCSSRLPGQ